MMTGSEQELTASVHLQRLDKIRKLHAQATRWRGWTKWPAILALSLAASLVPSGAGILVAVTVSVAVGLLAASFMALDQRVDAVVQVLEASGAFTLDTGDRRPGQNEVAESGAAGQQEIGPDGQRHG
jgi:uncharacterized protein (DUF58 family)